MTTQVLIRFFLVLYLGFYLFKEDVLFFIDRHFIHKPSICVIHPPAVRIITQLYGDFIIIEKTSYPINTAAFGKKGVIGKIVENTRYTQKIQLITNTKSSIPVYIKDFGKAILRGSGHNKLVLEYIYPFEKSIRPKKGAIIYTLGIDGVFPKHIPIAIAKSIDVQKNITCRPYENIDQISAVVFLKPF